MFSYSFPKSLPCRILRHLITWLNSDCKLTFMQVLICLYSVHIFSKRVHHAFLPWNLFFHFLQLTKSFSCYWRIGMVYQREIQTRQCDFIICIWNKVKKKKKKSVSFCQADRVDMEWRGISLQPAFLLCW